MFRYRAMSCRRAICYGSLEPLRLARPAMVRSRRHTVAVVAISIMTGLCSPWLIKYSSEVLCHHRESNTASTRGLSRIFQPWLDIPTLVGPWPERTTSEVEAREASVVLRSQSFQSLAPLPADRWTHEPAQDWRFPEQVQRCMRDSHSASECRLATGTRFRSVP